MTRRGNLLFIRPNSPTVENIIRPAVEFTAKDGVGTKNATYKKQYLYERNDQEKLIETYGGLRQRLTTVFKNKGYCVKQRSMYKNTLEIDLTKLTEEDLSNLEGRNDQIDVIGLVCDHPEGFIVKAPTGWGKSYLIVQVCKVLPKARIAIVSPGKDVTQTLYKRLKRQIRDVGLVGGGSNYISRITVSTMESCSKLSGYEWDLLLFDEVHRAASPVTANTIAEVFHKTKCVGLSASPTGRSDGADLVTEALFGPIIYEVNYQSGVDRGAVAPIKVKMYRIDRGPKIESSNSTTINRQGLWRNRMRNKFIAKLAKQIPEDEQVLIVVDTAEHGLLLRHLLPDYELVFSTVSSKAALKKLYDGTFAPIKGLHKGKLLDGRRERLRKDFEEGTLKKVIATGVWNTGVDFTQLQWLIRADGLGSPIQATQTPGRLSRVSEGKHYGMLIDFMDMFCPALERRSLKRLRSYRSSDKEWNVEICYDPDVSIEYFSKTLFNK